MRTLIYKRTHNGDPDPETGQFGIYDCMGRVRAWDFEAVILTPELYPDEMFYAAFAALGRRECAS